MVDNATPTLDWVNVGLGLSFVLFNAAISSLLELGVGRPLLTAAIRSILQLMMVVILLQAVFQSNSPLVVAVVTGEPNPLGNYARRGAQGFFLVLQ
jgi:ABC-type iron transport system FetAB permease component